MTHTLHRQGSEQNLADDYVLLCMAAKGINEEGAAEKMREFIRICLRHEPVNAGDMKTGNIYNTSIDKICGKITSTSIVHSVFTDAETVSTVLAELKKADLGMSVVLSSTFASAVQCCKRAGLSEHTADFSGGTWGRKEKLPSREILEITTMCGHAMIAPNLVGALVKNIKNGEITAEEAGIELAKRCECGIFNPYRAAKLLYTMACGRS